MTWSHIVNPLSIIIPRSRAKSTILTDVDSDDRTGTSWPSSLNSWYLQPVRKTWLLAGFSRSYSLNSARPRRRRDSGRIGRPPLKHRRTAYWCRLGSRRRILVQGQAVIRQHATELSRVQNEVQVVYKPYILIFEAGAYTQRYNYWSFCEFFGVDTMNTFCQ